VKSTPYTFAVLTLIIAGCSVGPNYRAPQTAMPKGWSETATNTAAPATQWWRTFNDPQLDSLIERAVKQNYDLRIASARLREARALRGVAGWDFGPTVIGNASYTRTRTSKNSLTFPVDKLDSDTYEAGFDARWEIDVFGGKRRSFEAANADLSATEEDRRDVLVTLLAEVARNYVELRGVQRQLVIAHDNIAGQQAMLDLTQRRYKAGASSKLDVAQSAALLAGTQSDLPTYETALKVTMHRLAVLLGQQPSTLVGELTIDAPIPPTPPDVPVGLPSELLRRRPDVRSAERKLAATTARIGVETAELFPKFSLVSMAGFQSLSVGDWFNTGSRFWTAGPTVNWRFLDFGRIHNRIKAADAREEQALAEYEKTVLTALEDVENALVAYGQEQVRRGSLQEQVDANRQAVDLANQLYTKGQSSFLDVLIARRALYSAEDNLVQSERSITTNLIALYKALGGGWQEFPLTQSRAN